MERSKRRITIRTITHGIKVLYQSHLSRLFKMFEDDYFKVEKLMTIKREVILKMDIERML
jgi:hypothetical protein